MKLETLSKEELRTFKVLVQLGDSEDLAFRTVTDVRERNKRNEGADEFYRNAYNN